MNETNTLTTAVAEWVTAVLPGFTPDLRRFIDAMLEGTADLAVEVRLREGTIILLAIDGVRMAELYREDVEPLRPGFAPPPDRIQ